MKIFLADRCGVDPAELLRYGREAIGGFKKPRHVVVVGALPRNASGKVLKRELRILAADRLGRRPQTPPSESAAPIYPRGSVPPS